METLGGFQHMSNASSRTACRQQWYASPCVCLLGATNCHFSDDCFKLIYSLAALVAIHRHWCIIYCSLKCGIYRRTHWLQHLNGDMDCTHLMAALPHTASRLMHLLACRCTRNNRCLM